jgi:hypothetical protein
MKLQEFVNIEYIKAVINIKDHGFDCGCTQCQINSEILLEEVPDDIKKIAKLITTVDAN